MSVGIVQRMRMGNNFLPNEKPDEDLFDRQSQKMNKLNKKLKISKFIGFSSNIFRARLKIIHRFRLNELSKKKKKFQR